MQPIQTRVAEHLAGAIRIPTVSVRNASSDQRPFAALHDYLARTYPRLHAHLLREVIGGALHYEWRGKDDAKPHVVLMGHLDVVPVLPGTESEWTHPPWSGEIEGGFLYGRGALDDKSAVIAILEAVEQLLGEGYQPDRTFHLAFGGDEEVGGERGAQQIVERLRSRGIMPGLVLDEGGALVERQVPGIALAAVIGIAEKGYLSLELSADAPGGHSSTPGTHTAIGRICRAIARLEAKPFPARLHGATVAMLRAIAPAQTRAFRWALSNLWLTGPLVVHRFLGDPKMATVVRTTTAPTMFHAGTTENMLPHEARAIVNFQILTGETTQSVIERVKAVIDDPIVRVQRLPGGFASEPSSVSDSSGPAFDVLAKSIREAFPESRPVPVPILTGPTDSRYWSAAGAENVFRFTPFPYERDWMARAHGTDERIAVGALGDGVRFYAQVVRNADAMT